jgi:hypothetical protein
MRYERSVCHAGEDEMGRDGRPRGRCTCNDHFVTPQLCRTRWMPRVIHDQFVTPRAITLSREPGPCDDQFVTHSYSQEPIAPL